MKDEDIPEMIAFNKIVSTFCVVFGALFIASSLLMIVGVSTSRKYLLVPWLVVTYLTLFGRLVRNGYEIAIKSFSSIIIFMN